MQRRFPKNAPGDFYTNGECLACDLPEAEARVSATQVCCVDAVRYGGKDKNIIWRVGGLAADFRITPIGTVVPAGSPWWKLW